MRFERLAETGRTIAKSVAELVQDKKRAALVTGALIAAYAGSVGFVPSWQCSDGVTIFGGQQNATYRQLDIECTINTPNQ